MDRRGFLKRCGLIPFVGSLATVVKSEAKQEYFEGHPVPIPKNYRIGEFKGWDVSAVQWEPLAAKYDKIFNGQVFELPNSYFTVITQFVTNDCWVLLSEPYKAAQHGGNAMMMCCYERKDGSYNPFYTQSELQEKLKDWKLIENKRLVFARVIKIR